MNEDLCPHPSVDAVIDFNRLEDTGEFNACVRLECVQCKVKFRFLGLPIGLDLTGAAVSPDGTEVRLACAPAGVPVIPGDGVRGFVIRKLKHDDS